MKYQPKVTPPTLTLLVALAGCTVTTYQPPPPQSRGMYMSARQGRVTPSNAPRCALSIAPRVDGNTVVAKVACGGQPLQHASVGLSIPLTTPDPRNLLAKTQLGEATDGAGEARFDLSGVQADAFFFSTFTLAKVYFHGEFDSGTVWKLGRDYSCPLGDCSANFDLKNCAQYPTWQAQAEAARETKNAEARAEHERQAAVAKLARDAAALDALEHSLAETSALLDKQPAVLARANPTEMQQSARQFRDLSARSTAAAKTLQSDMPLDAGLVPRYQAASSTATALTRRIKALQPQVDVAVAKIRKVQQRQQQAMTSAIGSITIDDLANAFASGSAGGPQPTPSPSRGGGAQPPGPSAPSATDRENVRVSCIRSCSAQYPRYGVCSDGGDDCVHQQREGQACVRRCDN